MINVDVINEMGYERGLKKAKQIIVDNNETDPILLIDKELYKIDLAWEIEKEEQGCYERKFSTFEEWQKYILERNKNEKM